MAPFMVRSILGFFILLGTLPGCGIYQPATERSDSESAQVPEWAQNAIFYQIFPERFRNGDPSNDPVRESLETPIIPSESWSISPWTGDWYARADWEKEIGEDFYEDGVFHRRYGGDIQGVIDKLPYLHELGINAIYFNPVFYARSLHKYDGNTFHHIDPYFGPDPEGDFDLMARETADPSTWHFTAADQLFLKLIEEAHSLGTRIIIDGVWNHTGRDFFAFDDLRKNQERSPYKDWYIVRHFDNPDTPENEFRYKGWWDVETLPEFADNEDGTDLHPGPKQYIFDATARWMDPNEDGDPSDGIDGWRLDVANEVPLKFWSDWNRHLRNLNPQAYTITEIWDNASEFIKKGGFSATMNYHGFAFPVKGFLIDNAIPPSRFVALLRARREEYSEEVQYALQNLIDSHDTDRLASMIVNAGRQEYENPDRFDYDVGSRSSPRHTEQYNVRKPNPKEQQIQRLVALFQMTYIGAPMVYYGTEIGMWGADDPDDRMPMIWPDLSYEPQATAPRGLKRPVDPVTFDTRLRDYYQQIIALRNSDETLRRGDFNVLTADDERHILAYSRTLGNDSVIIVLNRSEEVHDVQVPHPVSFDRAFRQVFVTGGEAFKVKQESGALLLELPPLSGIVLRSE